MKFEKFVKSLASTGTIYERPNGDRWLASPTAFMLIPPNTKSITGVGIHPMPENIEKIIDQIGHAEEALLVKAVMPIPNGAIRDCLRVFETRDGSICCVISNDDWSLLDKSDMTYISSIPTISTRRGMWRKPCWCGSIRLSRTTRTSLWELSSLTLLILEVKDYGKNWTL